MVGGCDGVDGYVVLQVGWQREQVEKFCFPFLVGGLYVVDNEVLSFTQDNLCVDV